MVKNTGSGTSDQCDTEMQCSASSSDVITMLHDIFSILGFFFFFFFVCTWCSTLHFSMASTFDSFMRIDKLFQNSINSNEFGNFRRNENPLIRSVCVATRFVSIASCLISLSAVGMGILWFPQTHKHSIAQRFAEFDFCVYIYNKTNMVSNHHQSVYN